MQMDSDIRKALASISWERKGDEHLGKLNYQIGPGEWKTLRAVTAMIRMPYIAQRKRFVLPTPFVPADIIRTTLEVGNVPNPKDHDFFPTPPDGAAYMCKRAAGDLADYILEPNAGAGAIVAAALKAFPKAQITAVEYDPLNCALLRHHYPTVKVIEADFLTWTPDREYDLVLMNPPFSANGGYAAHIQKAMACLRSYGKLYSITAANLLYKSDKAHKAFLAQVAEWEGQVEDFEFEFADTGVKTMLLDLTKRKPWMHEPYHGHASYKDYLVDFEAMNSGDCNDKAFKWAEAIYAREGDPVAEFQPFAAAVRAYFRDNGKIYIGISFTDEELKRRAWEFYRDHLEYSHQLKDREIAEILKPYPEPTPAKAKTVKAAPPPPVQAETVTELWKMTRGEYHDLRKARHDKLHEKKRYEFPYSENTDWGINDSHQHWQEVKRALETNEPVPASVLADYPEFANLIPTAAKAMQLSMF